MRPDRTPVGELFQTVFQIGKGLQPILFGDFDDAIDNRAGLRAPRGVREEPGLALMFCRT